MTVIAWDGKILAADKQTVWGTIPKPTTKIFTLSDGVRFGACGFKDNVEKFRRWVIEGRVRDQRPNIIGEFYGILVEPNGLCFHYNEALEEHNIAGQWAIGSGGDFAMGAMLAGKSAIEAVEIAIQLDVNSGIGVDICWPQ